MVKFSGIPAASFDQAGSGSHRNSRAARFADVRPVDLVKTVRAPLLLILSGDDPFVPSVDAESLEASAKQREASQFTSVWHVPGCPHIYGYAMVSDAYRSRVREFCESVLGVSESSESRNVVAEATTPAE